MNGNGCVGRWLGQTTMEQRESLCQYLANWFADSVPVEQFERKEHRIANQILLPVLQTGLFEECPSLKDVMAELGISEENVCERLNFYFSELSGMGPVM